VHYYHARGYYDSKVRAGRVIPTKDQHVRVEIVVEEGQPVRNRGLSVSGTAALPPVIVDRVMSAIHRKLPPAEPFDEDGLRSAEADARRALTDHGYAYATVTSDVFVDVVRHVADTSFTVVPGDLSYFGSITIVGLDPEGPRAQEIPEAPLHRAINIKQGAPYSTAAIQSATQALLDLGVFSSVEIVPYLPDPPPANHVVTVTVKVEPSRLRQWRIGGGIEFDELKTDIHGLIGWENHNFLGGLRDFTVDFKPGVVLYPTRINNLVAPTKPLLEERLRLQLKQPGLFEARTEGFFRPELNVFPLLVQTNPNPADPVVGYVEGKGAIGVDRTFWKLFVSLSYNLQVEDPFNYVNDLPSYLKDNVLILSYPDLLVKLDLRDDRVKPHKGFLISNDLQVAGLGGKRDVKIQPEVRTYLPLSRRVTFATRGTLGWLFPIGNSYGAYVENNPADPANVVNVTKSTVSDIEAMYFRGFFSGGPSQNRGFPIRGIAPYGYVPFLNPQTGSAAVGAGCDPTSLQNDEKAATSASSTPQQLAVAHASLQTCLLPIGGFTLWELSNEFRFAISGPLSSALFCDMSDAGPTVGKFRFNYPHLSCGAGARYDTPVGPIRLDIAYRVPFLQVLGQRDEADAATVAHTSIPARFLDLPIGVAFGIGEAY
jgi:outer membrane protein insertion porin family/translocation and assembly module TamA